MQCKCENVNVVVFLCECEFVFCQRNAPDQMHMQFNGNSLSSVCGYDVSLCSVSNNAICVP